MLSQLETATDYLSREFMTPAGPCVVFLLCGRVPSAARLGSILVLPRMLKLDPGQRVMRSRQFACSWIIDGQASLTVAGHDPMRLRSGDCFQISGLSPDSYSVDWDGAHTECWFGIDGISARRLAAAGCWEPDWQTGHIGPNADLLQRYRQVAIDMRNPSLSGGEMLHQILGCYQTICRLRQPAVLQHDDDFIARSCALLIEHFQPPPQIEEVAARLGMSGSAFRRRFKKAMGCSARSYQTQERLRAAVVHLRKLSVAETARCCGFSNSSSMARCFRRVYGCLPQDFRGGMADGSDL
jgi:AraC-like DNA-binding protein